MKAACVTGYLSSFSGGVSHAVVPLVRALKARGLHIGLFGLQDPRQAADQGCSLGCRSKAFGPWSFGLSPDLSRSIRRSRPELVHAHGIWAYPSCAAYMASRRLGVPRIVSPHGMLDPWTFRRSSWRRDLAAALFEGANLKGAACIHALNSSELNAVRAYGLSNPVAVIPNGVDLPDEIAPEAERSRTLLFLGRVDPKKGVAELLRAWALMTDAADWRLQITGWGDSDYVATMRRFTGELGIAASVNFSGPSYGEDKAAAFRGAAGFILPSFSEGLPMAVLEAWSYGLPVLMTRECNLPEGFAAGAAVEMTTAPEAIAASLREFMVMPDPVRRAMGTAGRRLVEEHFAWDRVAAEMHEVYTWVLGGGPPPSCVVTD